MDLIYALFGKRIARKMQADAYKPQGLDKLTFAYTADGQAYYAWRDLSELPLIRTRRIEEILMQIDAGISREKINAHIDEHNALLMGPILTAKDAKVRSVEIARAVALNNELKLRSTHMIPEPLYYELAAITICREDENPSVIDESIHQAKAAMLLQAGRAGADFFTRMPVFTTLLRAWLTSAEGLAELLTNWTMEKVRSQRVREVLSSKRGSEPIGKSSTNSSSGSARAKATAK